MISALNNYCNMLPLSLVALNTPSLIKLPSNLYAKCVH